MKLWLLRPVEGLAANNDPWMPWYDKAFGFVVRAETEIDARNSLLSAKTGDEVDSRLNPWLDPNYSTCVELLGDGDVGVILSDFRST